MMLVRWWLMIAITRTLDFVVKGRTRENPPENKRKINEHCSHLLV